MSAVALRSILIAGFSMAILACGTTRPTHVARQAVAVTGLTSARLSASVVHRSCTGERYCREDVIDPLDAETISDLNEQCARRGGTSASTRCVRDGAVASCSINGDDRENSAGRITVLAYAPDAATTVAEHCDAVEGTFERIAD